MLPQWCIGFAIIVDRGNFPLNLCTLTRLASASLHPQLDVMRWLFWVLQWKTSTSMTILTNHRSSFALSAWILIRSSAALADEWENSEEISLFVREFSLHHFLLMSFLILLVSYIFSREKFPTLAIAFRIVNDIRLGCSSPHGIFINFTHLPKASSRPILISILFFVRDWEYVNVDLILSHPCCPRSQIQSGIIRNGNNF